LNTFIRAGIAAAALLAAPAFAYEQHGCDGGGDAMVMRARVDAIDRDLERLELAPESYERQALAELNMKRLREASAQLRHRELTPECRVEIMTVMLNAIVRNEQAVRAGAPE
jgi:hypothetical protein